MRRIAFGKVRKGMVVLLRWRWGDAPAWFPDGGVGVHWVVGRVGYRDPIHMPGVRRVKGVMLERWGWTRVVCLDSCYACSDARGVVMQEYGEVGGVGGWCVARKTSRAVSAVEGSSGGVGCRASIFVLSRAEVLLYSV